MPDEDDPFRAIADPTRRRILDLLAERDSLTVGQLATEFPDLVSSGISKHLMTLRAAGLVIACKEGRNRRYRIDADGITVALRPWVARYEAYWTTALDKLRDAATEAPTYPMRFTDRHTAHVDITFPTTSTPDAVWKYFTEPALLSNWHGHAELFEPWPGGRVRFADDGWPPVEGVIEVIEPHRRIQWRVPADDSTVIETFRGRDSGTEVRVQQSGLTAEWPLDGITGRIRGWEESIADLVLILDHGVHRARHMARPAHTGMVTLDIPAGLAVDDLTTDGPADRAGLRRADILLSFDGAPVYRRTDLGVLLRTRKPGQLATVQFVRDRQIHTAIMTLT